MAVKLRRPAGLILALAVTVVGKTSHGPHVTDVVRQEEGLLDGQKDGLDDDIFVSSLTPTSDESLDFCIGAQLGLYPGYVGPTEIMPGQVALYPQDEGFGFNFLIFNTQLSNFNSSGGIHVHTGSSCEAHELVGGHYFGHIDSGDPYSATVYHTDFEGVAYVSESNNFIATQDINEVIGRTVVLDDSSGSRIACGVIRDGWCEDGAGDDDSDQDTDQDTDEDALDDGTDAQSDSPTPSPNIEPEEEEPVAPPTPDRCVNAAALRSFDPDLFESMADCEPCNDESVCRGAEFDGPEFFDPSQYVPLDDTDTDTDIDTDTDTDNDVFSSPAAS